MYLFFRDLAIILIAAKFFGLIARKLKAPQVVGEIIAGLLIGPSLLGVVQLSDTISVFAEIGVILLMFSTGLGRRSDPRLYGSRPSLHLIQEVLLRRGRH